MKEKLICITTPSERTYYKVQELAKEFLDKERNVINTSGQLPDGKIEEYTVSSVTHKELENGKLNGTLQMVDLNTNAVTFSEQYHQGALVRVHAEEEPAAQQPKKIAPAVSGTILKTNKNTCSFYVNGQEVAEETLSPTGAVLELLGNIPNGEVKELDENNKIKSVSHYKNNKRQGTLIRYDEDGDMISREEYDRGILQGPAENVSYSKNDFLHTKCTYDNALLEGLRIATQKDGTVREKENYSHGLLNGECFYYYQNGTLESKEFFKDGKREGERVLYFPTGKIWCKEQFSNGMLEGPRILYFENGQVYSEEMYKNGVLDGPRKVYSQNGTLLTHEDASRKPIRQTSEK